MPEEFHSQKHMLFWETQNEDGTYEEFAERGDSGSVIIRIQQHLEETPVTRSEAVGILYAIVYEEPRDCYVALYIPMKDVYEQVRDELGLSISVDGVPVEGIESRWPYTELGYGRSTHDLKSRRCFLLV